MQKDLSDLNQVWKVKPLKMTGENEARKILENVTKQVQPSMYKRKWKVRILSEFCPSSPSLMGLNVDGGAEIKLRLRRPERQWDFFSYEQILDTMLHELCHNEIGPHNTDFYRLLDELRLECEELMEKGVAGTGRGFDLPGRRLGGFSKSPPLPLLRQSALTAAERRAQRASGPRRIGADNDIKGALSPIQAAAIAAERRMRDELWCGSKPRGDGRGKADVASSSTDSQWQLDSTLPSASSSIDSQWQLGSTMPDNLSSSVPNSEPWQTHADAESRETWQCNACTLINKPLALICEACQIPRSNETGLQSGSWSCKFCTLINSKESERCSACEEWRYSYGLPAGGYTSHVGT